MKIKLKNLILITEAPKAPTSINPQVDMSAGKVLPSDNGEQSDGQSDGQSDDQSDETSIESPISNDDSPLPEDPHEYDFTKDFRDFEDKKNKAEAEAKKILLDKMNERLLNKNIVANASRGYGQPKTDYNINNVKKISVEFWYKDYVIIVSDENDKKYFLTTGVNIKIEEPEKNPQTTPVQNQDTNVAATPPANPTQPPKPKEVSGTSQKSNIDTTPIPQSTSQAPAQAPTQAKRPPTTPQQPQEDDIPIDDENKQKKLAEWIQSDLNKLLSSYIVDNVKVNGKINFNNYLESYKTTISENCESMNVKCSFIIPKNNTTTHLSNRDIKLSSLDIMKNTSTGGYYTDGCVNVSRHGTGYLVEYIKKINTING